MKPLYGKMLEVLNEHGVQHIFGIVGDAINPLVEAIRLQDNIQFVHVNHEEGGAIAASAVSKLTGKMQVCAGTVGPGALHLLNGLYDAKKDHTPVLAVLGQVPTGFMGSDYHQEINLASVFEHVAEFATTVTDVEQFPYILARACNTAIERHGVSVVIIPQNIGSEKVEDVPVTMISEPDLGSLVPQKDLIEKARNTLNKQENITILAGRGCKGSEKEVLDLSKKLNAPIITTLKAKDLFHYNNEQVAGGLGLLGSRGGVHAMKSCDVLLVLGSDFPYRDWYNQKAGIIRIDRRASSIGQRIPGELAIHSDLKPALEMLNAGLKSKEDNSHLDSVIRTKELWNKLIEKQESLSRSDETIHPQGLTRVISDLAADDAIFTCDTGEVTAWAARHLYLRSKQQLTVSYSLATMAFALPAAVGIQLTFPERQVISLSGDGGFNMLMGEFLTAVKYKLPVKVVVFNNHKLGLIKMEQEVEGYPEHETELQNPDYKKLAEAMGGKGYRIENPAELKKTIQEALQYEGPAIIDVKVNPGELTLPPKISVKQAFGYGLSKVREIFE